jgi:type I restriction enzyme S subunit
VSEWQETKLGGLGKVITGKTPSKDNPEDWGHEVLFITPSDYKNYGKHANSSIRKLSNVGTKRQANRLLPKGSVLVTCIGSDMGKTVINAEPCVTNQQINAIIPNNEIANSDFIYYLTKDLYETLSSLGSDGTAVPILNKSDFENIDVSIPNLEEQKSIASVLSSLDDKIDLLHRQNTTLEAMAETLFRQWFVEEAQEDWELILLGDLFEISSGKGLKKEQLSDTGLYPVLGANGEIGKTNDFLFNEKLIFTGRVGTLGNFFRVNNEKVWLSDNTLIFRNIKYFYFIYFTLQKAGLSDYNVGSTQPLIRQSDIKCIEILIPKKQEKLYQFETESELIFTKINSNNKQIQTLEKLRDNLLPKLMSGEVRLTY